MKKITIFITAMLLLGCGALYAAPKVNKVTASKYNRGWYVGVRGGVGWIPAVEEKDNSYLVWKKYNKMGYHGSVAIGYANKIFFNMFRTELSFGYHSYKLDYLKRNGVDANNVSGKTTLMPVMLNVYFDLVQLHSAFVPYFGVGMGWVHIKEDIEGNNHKLTGTDDVLGSQYIIGFKYRIKRHVAVTFDYRYLMAYGADFKMNFDGTDVGTLSENYTNHTLNLGVEYYFG